jgi:hypothetical protein
MIDAVRSRYELLEEPLAAVPQSRTVMLKPRANPSARPRHAAAGRLAHARRYAEISHPGHMADDAVRRYLTPPLRAGRRPMAVTGIASTWRRAPAASASRWALGNLHQVWRALSTRRPIPPTCWPSSNSCRIRWLGSPGAAERALGRCSARFRSLRGVQPEPWPRVNRASAFARCHTGEVVAVNPAARNEA